MSAHGSRIKYSEKCQHHNPAAFINNGGLSAMPRHLLAGSRRHRVGAWGSQCTDSVLPLALHGCGLWPRKTRAAAWRFIVAGMAAGTPRALPRDLLWREDGSTPCGTRTRNLRIRSLTPCPLGQGGSCARPPDITMCAATFLHDLAGCTCPPTSAHFTARRNSHA